MQRSSMGRWALGAMLALVLFSACTTAASASTGLRLASGTALTVTASGPVTWNWGLGNVICTWDMSVVVDAAIQKAVLTPFGTVQAAGSTISRCNGGYTGTIDADAPLSYVSFSGVLPAGITGVSAVAASGLFFTMTGGTVFGANRCQYRSNPAWNFTGPGTSFRGASFSGSVAYAAGPAGCPRSMRITNAALTFSGTLTSIAITLF